MIGIDSYLTEIFAGCAMPRDRLVMMLTTYLDGAGNEPSSPFVTMAGHVGTRYHWGQFEKRSNRLFATPEYNVDVFHAIPFMKGQGCFIGWTRTKRSAFLSEWAAIAAHKKITGVTVTIPRQKYKEAQKLHKVNFNVSPLHQCFMAVLRLMLEDKNLGSALERHGVSFFVEDGDKTAGIERWYRAQQKLPGNGNSLRGLSLIPKTSCRAIQYADALAFFSRRRALRSETHGEANPPPEFMSMLEQHRHIGGIVDSFTRSDVPVWKLKPSWSSSP